MNGLNMRVLLAMGACLFVVLMAGPALAQTTDRIDINTASVEELMGLKGIGKTYAERIVSHRENVGPFTAVDDLIQVKGIGAKTIEPIRDRIMVSPVRTP
ncbi:helix-hairpin-helix domain-containing protein [Desulfobotulus sp. H1]|uniref:Helix-hairpin-helix domain-containing protein n=1 Tax=Desulfobotulus pelophilus TaxID=2823377 RepID=A0ABT3N6Q0_9BACT|nr:helix-hairpin-helix domain-containing protein [Desulfobotulus pelophilus]MCW7752836.1 helix-hairpin-helix domain-containing protein [Desulfobotulus pelophilus]